MTGPSVGVAAAEGRVWAGPSSDADRAGLLYRLTAAISGEGLDVTSARIETLGGDAVDSFYVCDPSGSPVDPDQRARVEEALVAATLGAPAEELRTADTPGQFR